MASACKVTAHLTACIEGSCKVAATDCSKVPSVPVSSSGFARGTPRGPTVGIVLSLEVKPTFLARVANATWHDADVEMRKNCSSH